MEWRPGSERGGEEEWRERFGKQRRGCTETVPRRDNSNGVVKIERGWGIGGERG